MRILLTGGSGDLGSLLSLSLKQRGDVPVVLDMAAPRENDVEFFQGSILDRGILARAMKGADCVIHIAAWHGIHENQKTKTPAEFHDLNVTGTFNVLEAAAEAGIKKFVFISSTSVDDKYGIYGHTKILGEEMARAYAHRHDMDVITLRPRAFIPSWNKNVYANFIEWANWFAKGAVHIADVEQSVLCAVDFLKSGQKTPEKAQAFTIDGAYDFTAEDLKNWDKDGPGSSFKKYYAEFYDLAVKHGLDPARRPKVLDIADAKKILGYCPEYSLRNMLEELRIFGTEGPFSPFDNKKKPPQAPRHKI
ncbi:MAG: NAD(P)-dependent oxidoreductase [Alphaproteobacteria bacterium]|nr:NAD(P)-dependent oxidoreductase [Alphaproteobacteria bacterium]